MVAWSELAIEDLQMMLTKLARDVPSYQTDWTLITLELLRWMG